MKIKTVSKPKQEKETTNQEQIEEVLTGDREMNANNEGIVERLEKNVKRNAPKSSVSSQRIGRNDLCPCGSGLKYKKCGLINSPSHKG